MKLSIVGIIFFFITLSISAQEVSYEPSLNQDKSQTLLERTNVHQDKRIDTLLQRHIEINKHLEGTSGYRIEIFFSSGTGSRSKALQVKTEFLKQFPDETAYMSFQTPNFKIRVGDFRTKSEALKLEKKISKNYPNAFIVSDIIQFPKLYTDTKQ